MNHDNITARYRDRLTPDQLERAEQQRASLINMLNPESNPWISSGQLESCQHLPMYTHARLQKLRRTGNGPPFIFRKGRGGCMYDTMQVIEFHCFAFPLRQSSTGLRTAAVAVG